MKKSLISQEYTHKKSSIDILNTHALTIIVGQCYSGVVVGDDVGISVLWLVNLKVRMFP